MILETFGEFDRRCFLKVFGCGLVSTPGRRKFARGGKLKQAASQASGDSQVFTLFLCGDVMTARGIDRILPHPGDPELHESYMKSAVGYVELAEQTIGPFAKPVDFSYIWGDSLSLLDQMNPDFRIINLETAVTTSNDYWKGKGIHYRMHPRNIPAITAARIDCCSLANNHVLDWGVSGLTETLETLKKANLTAAGAGLNLKQAGNPAILEGKKGSRLIVFSFGTESSGISLEWAAAEGKAGVNLLLDLSQESVARVASSVRRIKQPGDIVVASIHWGGNWGYSISAEQREFAHALIDEAEIDLIHGHSSHHPLGIEVYRDHAILYGCGDFINDYEGIGGYQEFRPELGLMYFPVLQLSSGRLVRFEMWPTRLKRFLVNRASPEETAWLTEVLTREGQKLGTKLEVQPTGSLKLTWNRAN